MYKEKFLQQVFRKIKEQGISNAELKDTCIIIYEGKSEIFKIDGKGSMFYSADKQFREIVDKLHEKIQPIVCDVDEYLNAMENSTELKAIDFNMPYRKLAEFNGVVFAGVEHEDGSFEFATWDHRKNALYHGHYNPDYQKAKEDFATRSGLVKKGLIFEPKEYVEIYRCIVDIKYLYDLKEPQLTMVENVQEKIKNSLPGFDELLKEILAQDADEEELNFEETINEQTM